MQFFHVGTEICVKEISAVHCAILYHLCNLVKREKHPWESVAFSKVTGLIISFLEWLLDVCGSRSLNPFHTMFHFYTPPENVS